MRRVLMIVAIFSLVGFQGAIAGRDSREEFARALVKTLLAVRGTIFDLHNRPAQERGWAWDKITRYVLTKNSVLPAVITREVGKRLSVPGRYTVGQRVPEPRNTENQAGPVDLELIQTLKGGAKSATKVVDGHLYYAEPIKVASEWCLACHGEPRGEPDPWFPQFKKDGWKLNEVIGAVVAVVEAGLGK